MNDITLPARALFHIGPIPVTDALLGGWLVIIAMVLGGWIISNKFKIIPTKIQLLLELVTDYIKSQLSGAFKSKEQVKEFLPFFMTMLLFLIVANQMMLVPFIFEITFGGADLIRQPTSDFAQPMALSLMIFVISQIMAFKISPIKHLSNFITLGPLLSARTPMDAFQGLILAFIGLLNIVGEFAKVVSLASRLFGNIFAGNVMVAVIIALASFTQFVVPLPFIVLSVFSGLVQSFVFVLLSIQFVALAIDGATPEPKQEKLKAQVA